MDLGFKIMRDPLYYPGRLSLPYHKKAGIAREFGK
jgi:hypothetical protein